MKTSKVFVDFHGAPIPVEELSTLDDLNIQNQKRDP